MTLDITVTIPDEIQGLVGSLVAIVIMAICVTFLLRAYANPRNRAGWGVFQRDMQALNNRLFIAPDIRPTSENQSASGWIMAALYSLFSAYFTVYAIAVMGLFFYAVGLTGIKIVQAAIFIAGLFLFAQIYRVEAYRARVGV